jgi:N-acetylneuraminic acid mutarotase
VEETWLWESGWTQPDVPVAPSSREGQAVTSLGGEVVLFGGSSPGELGFGSLNDTWVWDGARWRQVFPATSPPGRSDAVFVTLGTTAVLFGGQPDFGDTWTWDGTTWTLETPLHSPGARYGSAAASLGGVVVLFGGIMVQGLMNELLQDTWQWDGTDWTELAPATSPPPRAGAMAGAVGSGIFMFGGITASAFSHECVAGNCFLADTWLFDGTTWTEAVATLSPPARAYGSMGSLGTSLLLFGGETNLGGGMSTHLSDTWTWNGVAWTEPPANGPTFVGSSGALGCY